ncbi:MAG: hypothetical protein K2X03_11645 [Bryobacteraceae bacterium]|nr:hypothetical protein [Bryobacteraceae bacterium]
MTEQQLRERMRKIAALFEGAKTAGEREAAMAAMRRVQESLDTISPGQSRPASGEEPLIEMQFSLGDQWQRRLFSALCRRYGLVPYRYRRQRRTTLMLRVKQSFLDRILWPEYVELRDALYQYLLEATERIIREEVFNDASEAQERPG